MHQPFDDDEEELPKPRRTWQQIMNNAVREYIRQNEKRIMAQRRAWAAYMYRKAEKETHP